MAVSELVQTIYQQGRQVRVPRGPISQSCNTLCGFASYLRPHKMWPLLSGLGWMPMGMGLFKGMAEAGQHFIMTKSLKDRGLVISS